VGKRVGEWVYELFITMLDAEGFLVEDVLDLYHGRGADRGRCWPMKTSKKIRSLVFLHRVWARAVVNCVSMGVEPAPLPGTDDAGRPGARDRVGPSQRSSCCLRR
jgi:hypothetical protein